MNGVVAIAALSARALVDAAADEGLRPIALDLFGDADTRRRALRWQAIGAPPRMAIDEAALLDGLEAAAREPAMMGWIAGSGFEGRDGLLAAGAQRLPLLGAAPRAWASVRDPRRFFAALRTLGIAHPQVCFEPPASPDGWLRKDLHASGGWHVRRARADEPPPAAGEYWQCELAGTPVSATLLACADGARIVGFNRQRVRRFGDRPYVFCGIVGPVALLDDPAAALRSAADALVKHFDLRGLASLDAILHDDGRVSVLEVNPRPPASAALYRRWAGLGLVDAHLRACRGESLPRGDAPMAGVRGHEIVFARRSTEVSASAANRLARFAHVHDLPRPGSRADRGDPLCSVDAEGTSVDDVTACLDARREQCLQLMETSA